MDDVLWKWSFFTTSRKFEQNTFELKIITRKKQPTTSITKCTLKRKKRDLIKVEFARWKEQQQVNCETNKQKKSLIYQLEWVLCLCSRFQWQSKAKKRIAPVCSRTWEKNHLQFSLTYAIEFFLLEASRRWNRNAQTLFSLALSLTRPSSALRATHN